MPAADTEKQYSSDKIMISNAEMSNEGSYRKLKSSLRVPVTFHSSMVIITHCYRFA